MICGCCHDNSVPYGIQKQVREINRNGICHWGFLHRVECLMCSDISKERPASIFRVSLVQKKNYGASGQTHCNTRCKNQTDKQNLNSTYLLNLKAEVTITARIFGFMFPCVHNSVQSLRYIVKKGYFALKLYKLRIASRAHQDSCNVM